MNNKKRTNPELFYVLLVAFAIFSIYSIYQTRQVSKKGVYVIGKLFKRTEGNKGSNNESFYYHFNNSRYEHSIKTLFYSDSLIFYKILPNEPDIARQVDDIKVPRWLTLDDVPLTGWKELPIDNYIYSYKNVDTLPEYIYGQDAVPLIFAKNFNYPVQQETLQFRFVFQFIVDENGKLINPKIKGKSNDSLTYAEKEGIRILKKISEWKPGKKDGKNVPVRMFLPITLN